MSSNALIPVTKVTDCSRAPTSAPAMLAPKRLVFARGDGEGADEDNTAEKHGECGQAPDEQRLGGVGQEGELGEVDEVQGETSADQASVRHAQRQAGEFVRDQVRQQGHREHAGDDDRIDLPGIAQHHRGLTDALHFQQEERGPQEEEVPV